MKKQIKNTIVKAGKWYPVFGRFVCCDCGLAHRHEWKVVVSGKSLNEMVKKLGGKVEIYVRSWRDEKYTKIARKSLKSHEEKV